MLLIRKKAFARAGLVGNPSDGYHGKTISLVIPDFWAEATLYEWDQVEVVWSQEDHSRFESVDELVRDVRLHGYYGGVRLVKATIKKFADYCRRQGHRLSGQNFSIRYQSNVPRQVGLAGSSAIIVATFARLTEFYGVEIPRRVLPSLALSVETEELGIAAGLQDRVVQVYEGSSTWTSPASDGGNRRATVRHVRAARSGAAAAALSGLQHEHSASRPRCFITICGPATCRASRPSWKRWPTSPT